MRKGLAVAAGVATLTLFDITGAAAQTGPFAGPYVGALTGGAFGNVTIAAPDAYPFPAEFLLAPSGLLAGTYAGVNVVVPGSGMFVGVEGFLAGGLIADEDTHTDTFDGDGLTITGSTRLLWQGGLLARAGFALGPVLVYGTGGVVFGGFSDRYVETLGDADFIPIYYEVEALSGLRVGWAAGAGAEFALGGGWAIRAQYLLSDFGVRQVEASDGKETRTVTFDNGPFHTIFLGVTHYF